MAITTTFTFAEDIRLEFRRRLFRLGIDPDDSFNQASAANALSGSPANWMARQWFHTARKLIEPHPRRVVRSQELQARVLAPHLVAALDALETRVEKGDDLTPWLSDRWRDLAHHDHLLNDWGFHHLHLSQRGSRELLYVAVGEDTMGWIDLLDHKSFENRELVDIVERNWPDAVAPRLLEGILPPATNPTRQEIARMRFAGVTPLHAGARGVYGLLGGGSSTSGMSIAAVRAADDLTARAREWEDEIRAASETIAEQIGVHRGKAIDRLELGLVFDSHAMAPIERGETLRLDPWRYAF